MATGDSDLFRGSDKVTILRFLIQRVLLGVVAFGFSITWLRIMNAVL